VADRSHSSKNLPWFVSTAAIAFAYLPLFAIVVATLPAMALLYGHVTAIVLWVVVVAVCACCAAAMVARRRTDDGLSVVLYAGGCLFACFGWAWVGLFVVVSLIGDSS
jgi:hypothetical protein